MNVTEKIEVRKIYLGKASLFGLLYGLVLGTILAIIVLIIGFTGLFDSFFLIGSPTPSPVGFTGPSTTLILTFSSISLLGLAIGGLIIGFVGALIYNLVSKIGGMVQVGLAEYEPKAKGINALIKKVPYTANAIAPVKNNLNSKVAAGKGFSGKPRSNKLVGKR